jgi:hypothetical protein
VWRRLRNHAGLAGLMTAAAVSAPAAAQNYALTDQPAVIRNTYGEVGILDMPSAHMAPDGELAFVFGDLGDKQRYSLSFQALPWLDTSFRFSRVGKKSYDRGFALKARLIRESGVLPDIAVGIRDIMGTGFYSGEYIVASKHIGQFDFTGGLGWGRLAGNNVFTNPFGYISDSFKNRDSLVFVPGPGNVNFGQFFHGPNTGVFGGLTWQTPVEDLKVLAEYSSDQYTLEKTMRQDARFKVLSPVNVGLSYQPLASVGLTAGWFYGTTYGFTLSLRGNPMEEYPSAVRIGPSVPPPALRPAEQQQKAISALHLRNNEVSAIKTGGPWVNVATSAERTRQNLLQAFYSEAHGVRDVEVTGKALLIDAHITGDPQAQCAGYARIAAASQPEIASFALSDLQDPSGKVTFCKLPQHAAATAATAAPQLTGPDKAKIEAKIKAGLESQALTFAGLSLGGSDLWIYYENYRYRDASEAAGRVIRVLMADAPGSVEVFHLVPSYLGVHSREITVLRSGMERQLATNSGSVAAGEAISFHPASLDNPAFAEEAWKRYPIFNISFDPKLTERVFDPDHPIQFMIYGDLAALLQIAPGLSLSTQLTGSIWDNYSLTRDPISALPHVRSDILEYLKQGKYGISDLSLTYRMRLSPTLFGEIRGGYLEDMYMGGGGQLLWQPENSRLSFGADLYQVWKRDFNRLFGAQSYHVITGHVSAYYRSPWYGLNFAVHAGRYLAGDRGATFEISRRFSSGVEIGAWATFTNVPFSRFGEGSFDKGIMLHIPLEWGLPIWSQSAYDLQLHSLTRDGGQRLAGDDSLYGIMRPLSDGDYKDHSDEFAAP